VQECYTALVWNVDLSDVRCVRYAISKVLGVGIVIGGGIVKVPQIIKIVNSKSARGVSLASYFLDTASLLITVAYNVRSEFPFSTYGENLFLVIQNVTFIPLLSQPVNADAFCWQVVITSLIISFAGRGIASIATYLTVFALLTYTSLSPTLLPLGALRALLTTTIPLSLSSKIPQIIANQRASSTGQLSAFLVFNSLAGCLARLFTTQTETGDRVLWWSFASAAVLNAVLALQMIWFWKERQPARAVRDKRWKGEKGEIKVETRPLTRDHTATFTPRSPQQKANPQRYTRKLD
jgi:mannose-P-dolichol utilization defect 1